MAVLTKKQKYILYGAIIVIVVLVVAVYAGLLYISRQGAGAGPAGSQLYTVQIDNPQTALAADFPAGSVTYAADGHSVTVCDTKAGIDAATALDLVTTIVDQNLNTQVNQRWSASIVSVPKSTVSGTPTPMAA